MSSEEQEQWKNRWLPKGLPETLLDEMIAEANAEYESELQYSPYNRYNSLGVIINDFDETENCYYFITIQRGEEVFQGKALFETEMLFAEIPTVEIVAQVFKLRYTEILEVIAFGYVIFNHTKDEFVTVDVISVSEGAYGHIQNASFEDDVPDTNPYYIAAMGSPRGIASLSSTYAHTGIYSIKLARPNPSVPDYVYCYVVPNILGSEIESFGAFAKSVANGELTAGFFYSTGSENNHVFATTTEWEFKDFLPYVDSTRILKGFYVFAPQLVDTYVDDFILIP